jgi:hypothetical protein
MLDKGTPSGILVHETTHVGVIMWHTVSENADDVGMIKSRKYLEKVEGVRREVR